MNKDEHMRSNSHSPINFKRQMSDENTDLKDNDELFCSHVVVDDEEDRPGIKMMAPR